MKEQEFNLGNPAEKVKDIYSRAIKEAVDREIASITYARLKEAHLSKPKFV